MRLKGLNLLLVIVLCVALLAGCGLKDFMSNIVGEEDKAVNESEQLRAHAIENGYATFIDFMEKNLGEEERSTILELLGEKGVNQGCKTLKYTCISGDAEYCYVNGVYTLPYNVRLVVKWVFNMEVDQYNENFTCNRHYAVIDPAQEAYMILEGADQGHKLIRILPDEKNDAGEAEVDYTREGFDNLLDTLGYQKRAILAEFARNPDVTSEQMDELVEKVSAYESVYTALREYAMELPEKDREEVLRMFDSYEINDGIEMIPMNQASQGEYYEYQNGHYTILAECRWGVKWVQNIAQSSQVSAFGGPREFFVKNRQEDAYLLFLTEDGHLLVCFSVE